LLRDKKVVGVFVRFRAPLHAKESAVVTTVDGINIIPQNLRKLNVKMQEFTNQIYFW
jgi:hypothetical protein